MSTIVLKKVGAQDYGNYIFTARSASVNASVIFAVHVYRKSSFLIEISKNEQNQDLIMFSFQQTEKPNTLIKWENGSATCVATGYPIPRIQWFQCEDARAMYVSFVWK